MSSLLSGYFGSSAPAPASACGKVFTRREVQACASIERKLVILFNGVYDLSAFVGVHPGGESVINAYIGRDATGAFEAIGHSDYANNWGKQYKVGEIDRAERV